MSRKQLLMGLLALFILVLGVLAFRGLSSMKEPPLRKAPPKVIKRVKVQTIINGTVESRIGLTGRLAARDKVQIFAEVGGLLQPASGRFREGNAFSKGAPMLVIDNTEARLNLMAQKAALLNQITLILPDLKLDYPEGFPAWKGYLEAFDPEKNIPPFPEPATEAEKYFISSKNLYNQYYTIRSAEERLRKYTIYAPFNGVVTEALVQDGTLVRVGQQLGTFANNYSYELEVAAGLEDLKFLNKGAKVELKARESEEAWTGTVARISETIDPNTQTVKVYVQVSGKGLREGMYLDALIAGTRIDQAVEIPRKLLDESNRVFAVKDSVLLMVPVEPIKYSTNSVVVKGIPDGTQLLNEYVLGAYEGMKVTGY
ncbi:MAG: HlyD family efflux transporter periplasmic adaptor subunit [Bacteroidia bacterium]